MWWWGCWLRLIEMLPGLEFSDTRNYSRSESSGGCLGTSGSIVSGHRDPDPDFVRFFQKYREGPGLTAIHEPPRYGDRGVSQSAQTIVSVYVDDKVCGIDPSSTQVRIENAFVEASDGLNMVVENRGAFFWAATGQR
jgi:hypothetical protein